MLRSRTGPKYPDSVRLKDWRTQARENPREMFEGDLVICAVGIVIVFAGSMVAAGGLYGRTRSNPTAPHPLMGTVIFFIGAGVILFGLVLALCNLALFLSAKRREGRGRNS